MSPHQLPFISIPGQLVSEEPEGISKLLGVLPQFLSFAMRDRSRPDNLDQNFTPSLA